jgi:hypothetical protein
MSFFLLSLFSCSLKLQLGSVKIKNYNPDLGLLFRFYENLELLNQSLYFCWHLEKKVVKFAKNQNAYFF